VNGRRFSIDPKINVLQNPRKLDRECKQSRSDVPDYKSLTFSPSNFHFHFMGGRNFKGFNVKKRNGNKNHFLRLLVLYNTSPSQCLTNSLVYCKGNQKRPFSFWLSNINLDKMNRFIRAYIYCFFDILRNQSRQCSRARLVF
jgi:hypothetical protein